LTPSCFSIKKLWYPLIPSARKCRDLFWARGLISPLWRVTRKKNCKVWHTGSSHQISRHELKRLKFAYASFRGRGPINLRKSFVNSKIYIYYSRRAIEKTEKHPIFFTLSRPRKDDRVGIFQNGRHSSTTKVSKLQNFHSCLLFWCECPLWAWSEFEMLSWWLVTHGYTRISTSHIPVTYG